MSLTVSDKFLPYDKRLKVRAQSLRKNATRWENKLWYECLKGSKPQFYRQRTIDHFIVDFYCPDSKLVIEIDGAQHQTLENAEYDLQREAILKSYGLKIIRFSNRQVEIDFENVKQVIYDNVNSRKGYECEF